MRSCGCLECPKHDIFIGNDWRTGASLYPRGGGAGRLRDDWGSERTTGSQI